jgi:hypothetical protein
LYGIELQRRMRVPVPQLTHMRKLSKLSRGDGLNAADITRNNVGWCWAWPKSQLSCIAIQGGNDDPHHIFGTDFSELKHNFSLAGQRASLDALLKEQALLLQSAALRQ